MPRRSSSASDDSGKRKIKPISTQNRASEADQGAIEQQNKQPGVVKWGDSDARLPAFLTAQNDFGAKEVVLLNVENGREARIAASEFGRVRAVLHALFGDEAAPASSSTPTESTRTEPEHPSLAASESPVEETAAVSQGTDSPEQQSADVPRRAGRRSGKEGRTQPPEAVPPAPGKDSDSSLASDRPGIQRNGFVIQPTSAEGERETYDVKVGEEVVARIEQDAGGQYNILPEDGRYKKSRHKNFLGLQVVLDVRYGVRG